tara:strand:- start:3056 stop:3598 length:543 start_codon:yes stop_codon:yes gene_type:complete
MSNNNRTKFVTGPVAIKYSHIVEPDTAFNKSEYKATVVASPELVDQLTQLAASWGTNANFLKQKDGETLVTFKSKFQPKTKVAEGVEPRAKGFAWSNDTVRIAVDAQEYNSPMAGHGISLRLNGVMLLEVAQRAEGEAGPADPFAEFGGTSIDASQLSDSDDSAAAAPVVPEFSGDDMPF